MATAELIAGYAAVVATAGAAWQIWSGVRANRPRVHVTIEAGVMTPGSIITGPTQIMLLRAANVGSRPVRLTGVQARTRQNHVVAVEAIPVSTPLPVTLGPGDGVEIAWRMDDVREAEASGHAFVFGQFNDASGHEFRAPFPKVSVQRSIKPGGRVYVLPDGHKVRA